MDIEENDKKEGGHIDMSRMKDEILKKEELDWADELINDVVKENTRANIIYNDLFSFKDLEDCDEIELYLTDGSLCTIDADELIEISGINIKWSYSTKRHKGETVEPVIVLESVPLAQITRMRLIYK